MRTRHHPLPPLLICLLLLIAALPVRADLEADLQTMQSIEADLQRESLALLAVFRTMAPTQTGGAELFETAKVVEDGAAVRDTREPDSRTLVAARLNDTFEVLERGDLVLKILLPDGREGWIDEPLVQVYLDERPVRNVAYTALSDDEMRRHMRLADDLFRGIDDRKREADELAAPWLAAATTPSARTRDALLASYRKVLEYHGYAAYFHKRFVGDADLSLAAGAGFRRSLSAWGEALLGKSSFSTEYFDFASDEVDENLFALALGGEVELSPRSRASAGFAKRNEVNQTAYSTTDVDAAYAFEPNADSAWRASVNLHSFADDLNTFNDFKRSTLRLANDTRRSQGRNLAFDYAFTNNSYENTEGDDYTAHALRASARTGTRDKGVTWRLRADLESSDAAFHDFTRLEPSVEWGKARGGTAWRALYENLAYGDAELRSYGRAELRMRRTGADDPRRSETLLALSRKAYPDNELQTYVQLRGRFGRTLTGLEGSRKRFAFYSNFFTEATELSYTDLRADIGFTRPESFRNLSVFARVWHEPGSDADAKAHVLDLNGRFGKVKGDLRYGPSVGAHFLMIDDGGDFLERDGNLVRVGAFVEGSKPIGTGGRLGVNASFEYGFVWTDPVSIGSDGTVTAGETVTRNPTTLSVNANAHLPLGESYDLSARLTLYRIGTDMDSVYDNPAPGTVTDNQRTTLFVGVRYRYN